MQILDQEICQNGLVSKEYDYVDGKVFRVEWRAIQVEREASFYIASATMEDVSDFCGRESTRVSIDITFGSRFTGEAYFVNQKRQIINSSPGLFFRIFEVLLEKGKDAYIYPWAKKHFRLCIKLVRKDVFRSYAEFGFGFEEVIVTDKVTKPFYPDEMQSVLLERFNFEPFRDS